MPGNFTDKSFWNSATTFLNNTNVATLGELNTVIQALGGSVIPQYGSQDDLGKRCMFFERDLQPASASKFVVSTAQQLFGGVYQAVKVDTAATAANVAAGKAAFILDTQAGGTAGSGALNYVVTDEAHALALTLIAGVFLNSITPGNFGFIQVHGKVDVLYNGVVTDLTVGDPVVVKGAGDGTFDALALATAATDLTVGKTIGYAIIAPAAGTQKAVMMNWLRGRY